MTVSFMKKEKLTKARNLMPKELFAPFVTEYYSLPHEPQNTLIKRPFENIVIKRENTGNKHFILLSQCFLLFQDQTS